MKTLLPIALGFSLLISTRAVEWQLFKAQVTRVLEALEVEGAALPGDDMRAVREQLEKGSGEEAADKIEALLDKHALVEVDINPESRDSHQRRAERT
jgi:hypothetical protein